MHSIDLSHKRIFSFMMSLVVHFAIFLAYVHLNNKGDSNISQNIDKSIIVKLISSNEVKKYQENKLSIDPTINKVTISSINATTFNIEPIYDDHIVNKVNNTTFETKRVSQEHAVIEQSTLTKGMPDYQYNPLPIYPMSLREQGITGVVWIRVWVESNGIPKDILVMKSSGYKLMDAAAVQSVKKWRFIPARKGHQYLSSWVEFPIRFSLQS